MPLTAASSASFGSRDLGISIFRIYGSSGLDG